MTSISRTTRCGLTVLEFVLALTVTAMVAIGVTGMLNVVSAGVGSRTDTRTVMVQADAARRRLGAYVDSARCVLDRDTDWLVLWLNDARESKTVHATEIRWFEYDSATGAIQVAYVEFPQPWTDTANALADLEYPSSADWRSVRSLYAAQGHLQTLDIVDGLASYSVSIDAADPMDARHVVFNLGVQTENGAQIVQVPTTIRRHRIPTN